MSTLGSPIPRAPFVDKNGYVTRDWLNWIYALFTRVGGEQAPSNTDLSIDMPEDSGLEELRHTVAAELAALNQEPPAVPAIPYEDLSPPYEPTPTEQFLLTEVRSLAEALQKLRNDISMLDQGRL